MNDWAHPVSAEIDFQAAVQGTLKDVSAYQGQGTVPSYIPALAKVDPRKLGIALALGDGSSFVAGDADEPYPEHFERLHIGARAPACRRSAVESCRQGGIRVGDQRDRPAGND